jgi:hypothetical protein
MKTFRFPFHGFPNILGLETSTLHISQELNRAYLNAYSEEADTQGFDNQCSC